MCIGCTDQAMPDMNGDELANAIKRISPDTPVILLTGSADLIELTDEKPAAVDYVAGKPMTQDEFRNVLAKASGAGRH
ncbi:MAG: response regulator [Candidatus Poribacteria bacterium]|nr:response regulator [Candidatus Poribacteria bacterium]